MGHADQIEVRRLEVRCEVPRDHPSPDRARVQVEEAARGSLAEALGRVLAPLASLSSDEVVLIRRLEVDLELELSRDPAELARRIAARVAEGLVAALADGRTPAGMLRFADEARYLARFLVDAAAGTAHSRWYYRRYEGLAPLPVAAALRTAIVEAPARGITALAALEPGELVPVLHALGGTEARRILDAVAAAPVDEPRTARAAEAVTRAAPAWGALALGSVARTTSALALLAVAAAELDDEALAAGAALVDAVVALAPSSGPRAAAAPTVDGASRSTTPAPPSGADAAPRVPDVLRRVPDLARTRLVRAVTGRDDGELGDAEASPRYTRHGGLVLLLPHVASLPIMDGWPDGEERALARLHVLARCAGASRAADVIADPTLRYLCGVGEDARADAAAELAGGAVGFERALVEASLGSARAIELAIGRHRGRAVLAVTAWPAGDWLRLAPLTSATRAALRADDVAAAAVDLAPLADDLVRTAVVTLRLATARRLTRALGHFEIPPQLAGLAHVDHALTLAAHQVMRAFARRLPEFRESSPGYLHDGFLACDATVEESRGARVCRLGRPPLAALLHLLGVTRGTFQLPWLGEVPFELRIGGRR